MKVFNISYNYFTKTTILLKQPNSKGIIWKTKI